MTMRPKAAKLAVAFLTALLFGCATAPPPPGSYRIDGKIYHPLTASSGFSETGYASWYGSKFHGRKTASGERYDMYGRTAAHKTLPLGTMVEITRLDNGRRVTARVNDRGPFVEGRIVDLTYSLAEELGMVEDGTARVRLVALDSGGKEVTRPVTGALTWQVGAFADESNARRLSSDLERKFDDVRIAVVSVKGKRFHRVYVGRYNSTDDADTAYARLLAMGLPVIPARIAR
ncbi:MAG: septal ring lytic transglycosylase RlpA family lipoprotein [Deltaproteobacteria bacterium]|nr:MAG: septal ring lytic transglycosylase RlpA family lipoprotein [Deltaproteobacteria bacterium]